MPRNGRVLEMGVPRGVGVSGKWACRELGAHLLELSGHLDHIDAPGVDGSGQ